jgi:hypothetical protein
MTRDQVTALQKRRLIITCVAAVVAAAALALVASRFATPADAAKTRQARLWTWRTQVPGVAKNVPPLAAESARAGGLDPASVRTVVSTGGASLVAARSSAGGACFGLASATQASSFSCRLPSRREAVLIRLLSGGSDVTKVDYAVLVGVARADVGRVAVTTVTDGTANLLLNSWRGFGYAATAPGAFPSKLSVYGKNGSLLQQIDLGVLESPS